MTEDLAVKLTEAERIVLRLCDTPSGFFAGDMSGPEKRTALRLSARGLLNISGGKAALITDQGGRDVQG